jgi:Fe-S oxidoreductase
VAEHILARKLDNVRKTGVRTLVTDNPGCILHLRGGIDVQKLPVRVLHIAELLAAHLGIREHSYGRGDVATT